MIWRGSLEITKGTPIRKPQGFGELCAMSYGQKTNSLFITLHACNMLHLQHYKGMGARLSASEGSSTGPNCTLSWSPQCASSCWDAASLHHGGWGARPLSHTSWEPSCTQNAATLPPVPHWGPHRRRSISQQHPEDVAEGGQSQVWCHSFPSGPDCYRHIPFKATVSLSSYRPFSTQKFPKL